MNANEIQLGDWVRLRYTDYLTKEKVVKTFQVSELRRYDKNDKDVNAWSKEDGNMGNVEHLEPILLTPEILEKNEWKQKKGFLQHGNFGNGPLMIWNTEDNKILRNFTHEMEISDLSSDRGFLVRFDCNYVHQLQHALRLCGIEKEITI